MLVSPSIIEAYTNERSNYVALYLRLISQRLHTLSIPVYLYCVSLIISIHFYHFVSLFTFLTANHIFGF